MPEQPKVGTVQQDTLETVLGDCEAQVNITQQVLCRIVGDGDKQAETVPPARILGRLQELRSALQRVRSYTEDVDQRLGMAL